jgi:hypothetical protein
MSSVINININDIPKEAQTKISSLSPSTKRAVNKSHGSFENFFATLYYLWFVDKREKSEIADLLNLQAENVHIHLYNLSWWYSNDYDENQKELERDFSITKKIFEEAKVKSLNINENAPEHKTLKDALLNTGNLQKNTYLKIGLTSKNEYIRVLYYIIEIEKLAPRKLIHLFGLSHGTIQQRLRALNLNSVHEDGIGRKKDRESQDYKKSLRAGKRTRTKSQLASFSSGSKNQEYVRVLLSNTIEEYCTNSKYECIIGLSNTGILDTLEIDIPVVIYDKETHQLHRFAIEYNGDYFHSAEKDKFKENLATEKGWTYMSIVENNNDRFSNNRKLLDQCVHDLCKRIKQSIM